MPGYFKLKRPLATKISNLPEGVMKDWAQMFRSLEMHTVTSANWARQLKRTLKECTLLEVRKEKEKDSAKKGKIEETIEKTKLELTSHYARLSSCAVLADYIKNKDDIESFIAYLGKDNANTIKQYVELTREMLDDFSKMAEQTKNQQGDQSQQ